MANSTLILYGIPLSGHVHRAQLMLNLLGLAYDDADGSAAARQTEAFLALNPLGQIPVLVDGDLVVPVWQPGGGGGIEPQTGELDLFQPLHRSLDRGDDLRRRGLLAHKKTDNANGLTA